MATAVRGLRPSPTLSRLLDEELAFSPSFQRYYSNHLAMSLAALDQMGAPPDVLQATFDAHARGESEPRDDWDVLEERRLEVAREGIEATVRKRAATLVDAPGSQLFHPVIRLAYALEVAHEGQVAAALLDWERRREEYSLPSPTPGSRRLPEVAEEIARQPSGTWPPTFDLDGIARSPELAAALAGVAIDEQTLDDISSFALAAHTVADEFITLHMVTGARAIRTVSGWLEGDVALRFAAHALGVMAVAYAAVGAPPLLGEADLDRLRHSSLPSREAITEQAIGAKDPHVIKLANVALTEEKRTSDPLYRYSAARVVALLPQGSGSM